jgi:hypothetical protein
MTGDRRQKNPSVRAPGRFDSLGKKYDESIQIETDGTRRNLDSWGAIADIHCNWSNDDGDGQWSFREWVRINGYRRYGT